MYTAPGNDRMKNFIVENKKRIRSRSRNNERKNMTSNSAKKRKSSLKKVKDALFTGEEKLEFYTYSD